MKQPSETQLLRSAVDKAVAELEGKTSAHRLARALMAKACDISLADSGMLATTWMTQNVTNLLAGHWSRETIDIFIETRKT